MRKWSPDGELAVVSDGLDAQAQAQAAAGACQGSVYAEADDAAGGVLALALIIAARDRGLSVPAAAALFSPWTDLAATGDSLVANDRRCAMFFGGNIGKSARFYLNGEDPCNPLASPLYAD